MTEPPANAHVTSYRRPWWKSPLRYWPLLIWLLVLMLASVLYFNGGKYRLMVGMVERSTETVASTETARVLRIHVREGDAVKAGDLVAELDTGMIDLEMSLATEDLQNRQREFALEELSLERQFAAAVQDLQARLFEAKTRQKTETAEAENLAQELKRLEKLRDQGLVDHQILSENRIRLAQLQSSLTEAPARIAVLEEKRDEALRREQEMQERLELSRQAFAAPANDPENPGTLALLQKRRENYSLRARHDGVVVDLNIRPGDVVQPATPAATLLLSGPQRVIGFLPESNANTVQVGQLGEIRPSVTRLNGESLQCRVVAVSPGVYSLPGRVSPIRGQSVRGQRVVFELENTEVRLIPGESVAIEIHNPLFASWLDKKKKAL